MNNIRNYVMFVDLSHMYMCASARVPVLSTIKLQNAFATIIIENKWGSGIIT